MRYAAVIIVALALSGCGGSAGGVSGGAASIVPGNVSAFVALDTHLTASQWQAVETLLKRFPVQDPLLAQLPQLQPVLGSEVDLAAIGSSLVVLTRSSKGVGAGFVSRHIGGWTASARTQDALEAVATAKTKLADVRGYRLARATLPGGALARAYASPAAAERLLGALPGQKLVLPIPGARRRPVLGGRVNRAVVPERYAWSAAAVVSSSHGLELEAHARVQPPPQSLLEISSLAEAPVPAYPARLLEEIPADALVVVDFQVMPGQFELEDPTTFPAPLRTAVAAFPTLTNQLDTILGGETALYLRQGQGAPELTLVTQPTDTQAAIQDIGAASAFLRTVPVLAGLRLHIATLGGELVVSTTQQGIEAFRAGGTKLSGDKTFLDAERAAAFPATTTGFVYADLRHGGKDLALVAPLFGVPVPATATGTLLFYDRRVGRDASSVLFLQDR